VVVVTEDDPGTGDGITPLGAPSDNTTLTSVLADFETAGFTASFGAREGARLHCSACRDESPVHDFAVDGVRRLEGASEPDAQILLMASTCPACGARGTAVFGYGPDASDVDAEAVADLDLSPTDPDA
jgi:hypothetical protein